MFLFTIVRSKMKLFLFYLCLATFNLLSSSVTSTDVNLKEHSVWSTLASDNELFCSHVVYRNSPSYAEWFDNICDRVREKLYLLQEHRITNVFVFRPPITHCYPHAIDVYVDTYASDHVLEARLRAFAQAIKEVSAEDINIHLIVAEFGSPFADRATAYGRYVMQNQLVVRQTAAVRDEHHESGALSLEQRNTIIGLTQRHHIRLRRGWLENGQILLTLHSVQDNQIGNNEIEFFRMVVEQQLHKPVAFVS